MSTLRIFMGMAVVGCLLMADNAQAQFEDRPFGDPPNVDPAPNVEPTPNVQPNPEMAESPETPEMDPFLPPVGMMTAPECLLPGVGFYGHHGFVYSAQNCFDLASACYKYCYFDDAIALLSHAISQDPQARYYHLRGMAQMRAGHYHDAMESADGVWEAQATGLSSGLAAVRERFNGPSAVNFRQLLLLHAPQQRGEG